MNVSSPIPYSKVYNPVLFTGWCQDITWIVWDNYDGKKWDCICNSPNMPYHSSHHQGTLTPVVKWNRLVINHIFSCGLVRLRMYKVRNTAWDMLLRIVYVDVISWLEHSTAACFLGSTVWGSSGATRASLTQILKTTRRNYHPTRTHHHTKTLRAQCHCQGLYPVMD